MADNTDDLDAELDQILSSDDELDAIVGSQPGVTPTRSTSFESSIGNRIGDTVSGLGSLAWDLFTGPNPLTRIPSLTDISLQDIGNTADMVGSGAFQVLGGAGGALTSPVTGPVGPAVGAAGGQALWDKYKQIIGYSQDIPASQEAGNFVGDTITNTAFPLVGRLLGMTGNAINSRVSKPQIDIANPQTAKLVGVTEGLERLSPEEAARIKASGKVKPDELKALQQTQDMTANPEGVVEALGGYEKRVDAVYERSGRLADKISDNPDLIKSKLDELRAEPNLDSAVTKLDSYLNDPESGLMKERSELVKRAEIADPKKTRISNSELTDIASELKARIPEYIKKGATGTADDLRQIASEFTDLAQKGKSLTLSDLDGRIKNNLAEQRAAQAYDVNPAARAASGNTSATVTPSRVTALRDVKSILDDRLTQKLDATFSKFGDAYGAYGESIGIDAYKQLNHEYSTFRPLLDQLNKLAAETRSGVMTKPTSSLQAPQLSPQAQIAASAATGGKTGLLNSVLKLVGMGDDVYKTNRAGLDLNYGRWGGENNRIGVASDLMSLMNDPANLATSVPNLFNPSAFEKVGLGISMMPKPALPRNVEISNEAVMDAMLKHLAPEDAQAMIQSVQKAEASGDETVKKKAYGAMLATVPELREEFEPGKTIASSEFDGIIADPNEKRALKMKISANIRSGKGSTIDAAKFVSNLNGDTPFKVVPKSVRQPKERVYNLYDNLGAFAPNLEPTSEPTPTEAPPRVISGGPVAMNLDMFRRYTNQYDKLSRSPLPEDQENAERLKQLMLSAHGADGPIFGPNSRAIGDAQAWFAHRFDQ